MKRVLFIDRDGTLIEEPNDFQVDSVHKLRFLPGVITHLGRIARESDLELALVTNQDGLGTASFPEDSFWPAQNFMVDTLAGEGIRFADIFVDRTVAADNAPTRKPGIGMLSKYIYGQYDLENSFVIGDRPTDVQLARNLGCKAIFLKNGNFRIADADVAQVETWEEIAKLLLSLPRRARHRRVTQETDITVEIDLDGTGRADLMTGISFFDHMLEQLARHGGLDLTVKATGDLHVDEHHTIEDVGITLGEAFSMALGSKRGVERYGFCLPMDDCLAQVALDLGGRSWIEWDADFKREMIGGMPTEMFFHFFKSFSDKAACNLNVKAEGTIEHHKIEAIFKAFARSVKMAVRREGYELPTTKGTL